MSPLLIILAVWLCMAILLIGLWMSRRGRPARYIVMHDIEPKRQIDATLDYREAA